MKYKKIFSILIVLFASFISINSYDALTPKEFLDMTEEERQDSLSGMDGKARQEFLDEVNSYINENKKNENTTNNNTTNNNKQENTKQNTTNTTNNKKSNSSTGEWCTRFNSIWFIIGRILQVIYVAVPLLLIVTGAISFMKAVTSKDSNALSKAQKSLVNKIIAAVLVFLLMPLTKIALSFVADEGWYDCAKCVFEPSNDCMDNDITTG